MRPFSATILSACLVATFGCTRANPAYDVVVGGGSTAADLATTVHADLSTEQGDLEHQDLSQVQEPVDMHHHKDMDQACPGGCDDHNPCTQDACQDGACENQPVADGTLCNPGGTNGGMGMNGMGMNSATLNVCAQGSCVAPAATCQCTQLGCKLFSGSDLLSGIGIVSCSCSMDGSELDWGTTIIDQQTTACPNGCFTQNQRDICY